MSSTPRHPIRLSVYTTDGVYYPREITEADGKLYLIDDDGTVVELNKTAVTKITDAAGTSIGSVDPSTGGTVAIPNASTSKRGLVVFGTSTHTYSFPELSFIDENWASFSNCASHS